jgi:hypothetical protein
VIYLKEAHAMPGWQSPANLREGVLVGRHRTAEERAQVAEACVLRLEIDVPTLLDDMNSTIDIAYCAWPDRLYVVGVDGRVAYQGGPGPFNFDADTFEGAIRAYLAVGDGSAAGSPRPVGVAQGEKEC